MILMIYVHIVAIAILSVVELRGAIPYGVINDFDPVRIVLLAIIGNILPVPFLILVIRKLFAWINKKIPSMSRLVSLLEQRASGKSELVINGVFACWSPSRCRELAHGQAH